MTSARVAFESCDGSKGSLLQKMVEMVTMRSFEGLGVRKFRGKILIGNLQISITAKLEGTKMRTAAKHS